MFQPVFRLFVTALMTVFLSTGGAMVYAQDSEQSAVKNELQGAIEAYQKGNQGDVIRYFMQRGYEGNVAAQFNLGVINYQREESKVGLREARFWFSEAAEEGDLVAQMNLGLLEIDLGLAQSDNDLLESGTRWLRRSAESGYHPAQVNLGAMLAAGKIVSPYENEGAAWLRVASKAGDPRAAQILQLLAGSEPDESVLSLAYPVELQLRGAPYRGGSKVKIDSAPVYAEPSQDLPPIASMTAGALVEVLDRDRDWVSVKIPAGLPVWIFASTVDIESGFVRVNRLEVPLYTAPNNEENAIGLGTVTKGEVLHLIEERGDWLLVRSPERFAGWMRYADIESKIADFIADSDEPMVDGKRYSLESLEKKGRHTAVMISDAEVLKQPDRSSAVVGVVERNLKVQVIEQKNDYVFAKNIRITGWVSAELLRFENSLNGSERVAIVDTETARVRSRPSVDSKQIGQLVRNQKVVVVTKREGWVRVEIGEGSGWILARLISEPSTEESAAISNESEIIATELEKEVGEEEQIASSDTSPDLASMQSETSAGNLIDDKEVLDLQSSVEYLDSTSAGSENIVVDLSVEAAIVQKRITREVGKEEQIAETEAEQTTENDEQPEVPAQPSGAQENGDSNVLYRTNQGAILYASDSVESQPLGRLLSVTKVEGKADFSMLPLINPAPVYGWVYASLTRLNAGKAEIITDGVRIRLDPTTARKNIIGARNQGDELTVLEQQGDWVKVVLDPVEGWVSAVNLERMDN
ncbi:MAG: SH3 domain-containing protein [Acidiferrobacterales bacterium]|nr:SH3 domain-containing protein [Acidiferrobacterales bacterium]